MNLISLHIFYVASLLKQFILNNFFKFYLNVVNAYTIIYTFFYSIDKKLKNMCSYRVHIKICIHIVYEIK